MTPFHGSIHKIYACGISALIWLFVQVEGVDEKREHQQQLEEVRVISLAYQPLFTERIELHGEAQVRIQGRVLVENGPEAYTMVISVPDAANLLDAVAAAIRTHAAELSHQTPDLNWEGMWCRVGEKQPDQGGGVVALDTQIETYPDIRTALLALDKQGHLTLQSIRKWLELSKQPMEAGAERRAFSYAEAAWRRSRFPHLDIGGKDDSPLKFKAARATFEAGQAADAITMVRSLAERRLNLLEAAWR